MLVKAAILLLSAWLLGLLGLYRIGDVFHGFFLIGLMLLLLAFARARDAALRPPPPDER
jgi:hypothetical protein